MGGEGLSVIGQGGSGFDPSWGDKKKPQEGGEPGGEGARVAFFSFCPKAAQNMHLLLSSKTFYWAPKVA